MVFGGARRERIGLNEATFYSGGPNENVANPAAREALPLIQGLINEGKYDEADEMVQDKAMGLPPRQSSYQPIGDLIIEMDGTDEYHPTRYRRELDMDTAMATTEFTTMERSPVTQRRKVIVSPDRQVLAVDITSDPPNRLNLNVWLTSPQPNSSVGADGGSLIMSGTACPENGLPSALQFEARALITSDGAVEGNQSVVRIRRASKVTIFLAIATNFKAYNDVGGHPTTLTKQQIASIDGMDFDALAKETAASHQKLYRRVKLDLGENEQAALPTHLRLEEFGQGKEDPGLVSLYFHYGRYLLITSSRPGGQTANLQGIWNESTNPSWGSKYTVNINIEMNYWPAEIANLPEMVAPLVAMLHDLSKTGQRTAEVMYGAKGWVCHHNTDLWRATAPIDGPKFGIWPTGGAWLCRHLWDHYEYSLDLEFLRSVYPILVGASQFFLDTLVRDKTGTYLVTNPSLSPENEHGLNGSRSTLCAGPTMDNAILRDLFAHTVRAGELLGKDQDLRKKLLGARALLTPFSIGKNGRLKEWLEEVEAEPDPHHRHTSNLFGLHPSHQIDPDTTPELAAACAQSLIDRGDGGIGWAAGWRINLWARLRNGNEAAKKLRELLSTLTFPNLMNVHPPFFAKWDPVGVFQIDGNLAGCSGILELLVQSPADTDEILLLPALPNNLATGSISGVRVRGEWEVSLVWKDHRPTVIDLKAGHAGTKRLRFGSSTISVELEAGKTRRVTADDWL